MALCPPDGERHNWLAVDSANAGTFEVMSTMRAMRRLKPDPVPDQMLTRLVEAATWAPSAANIQGHAFVVVTDRTVMAQLAELVHTFALIPVGWPMGRFGPTRRRPAADLMHRDRW